VKTGLTFRLGTANPSEIVIGRLPSVTQSGGDLILNFKCLPVDTRGGATLKVAHSTNIGSWTSTAGVVPNASSAVPDNHTTFVVGAGPVGLLAHISGTTTIDSAAAASTGKNFARLKVTGP
jgi:hypothetical protein